MDANTTAQIMDILERYVFNVANIQGTLRLATPVVLAGLCALITSRAGILNIAGEGLILFGAWFGVLGSYLYSNAMIGVAFAMVSGFIIAGLFALFSLKFRANIIIMGIAINIFAQAATIFLTRAVAKTAGVFADRPHLCLEEHFWDGEKRTATTRFYVVDAATGAVEQHAMSMEAYTQDEYRALVNDCGFGDVTVYPSLGGIEDPTQEGLIALVGVAGA